MKREFQEKGQALILIALAAIALVGFAALAIDGSMKFSDQRHAQNAADAAALAAALAATRNEAINPVAISVATTNGYDGGDMNNVTVTAEAILADSGGCPGGAAGTEITVTIESQVKTTFARVVGWDELENEVTATSRGCGFYQEGLFEGNAIVGLRPNDGGDCGFDSGNTAAATWVIEGGGIFSNGCAWTKPQSNPSDVTLDPGTCVTSVGSATGFDCTPAQNQSSQAINYPDQVLAMMPDNPCDGDPDDVGLPPPASGSIFINGVYCIDDLDSYDQEDIVLFNATLYVTDMDFSLKFAGGGGLYGTSTTSGEFADYYMVIAYNGDPCERFSDHTNSQVIEWRGNGGGGFTGTIFAPSACVDLRGNGQAEAMHSQVIAYIVGSNGTADVHIVYEQDEHPTTPVYPAVTLLR